MVYMYVYVVVSESKKYKAFFTHPSKSGLRVVVFFLVGREAKVLKGLSY